MVIVTDIKQKKQEVFTARTDRKDQFRKSLHADALVDASQNAAGAEKNTADGGGVKYSLRAFEDGTRFVDVKMDAHTFDGVTVAEMNRKAKSILMAKFAGKVIGIDNPVFVNGDSVNEYLHPSKSINIDTRKAKLTAAGELDNLLDAGTALPNEPDGKDGHTHPDAIDFSYYKTIFKVVTEYFEGIVNVKNIKRGKLLKDVTKIRNITEDIVSSYGQNPKSNFLRDASMDRIRSGSENVNKKYSLRDSAYMDAVDHGDTETAQRMVDEAAKAAGYTIKAYHGTTNQEEHSTWNAERREWDTTYTPITVFKRQYDEQAGHFFSADVVDMAPTDFEIKNAEPQSTATTNKSIGDIIGGSAGSNIPQERTKVNKKFSQRDPEAVEVNRAMEKENARLDVSLPFRCQNGTQKWQWNE